MSRRFRAEPYTLAEGLRGGLFVARVVGVYAGAVVLLSFIGLVIDDPAKAVAHLPEYLRITAMAALGYIVAFAAAGVLFAALSRARRRFWGFPLTGFVLGATIYGLVGLAMKLFGHDMRWRDIPIVALMLGVVWGLGGLGYGLYRLWTERRPSRRSA